jgi:tRNA threonylcarbamoyladenosine biosynthesis protein TsaE
MKWTVHTFHVDETIALGEALASVLKQGDIIALSGQLGSGKTTLVHGIGKGLGVKGVMPSPTFTLMRSYPLKDDGELLHVDAYRLRQQDTNHELIDHDERSTILCLEWPEHIPALFERANVFIACQFVNFDERVFSIQTHESRFERIQKLYDHPRA